MLRVQRQRLAIRFHPGLVFLICEIRRAQVAVGDRRIRSILERLLVGAFRLLVFVLTMVDRGQVVERVGIARIHGQRVLVILARLIEGKHVVVSDTDFVPDHSGSLVFAFVSLNRGSVASVNHKQIAFNLGRERGGRRWGGHIGGRRRRVGSCGKGGVNAHHERENNTKNEAG